MSDDDGDVCFRLSPFVGFDLVLSQRLGLPLIAVLGKDLDRVTLDACTPLESGV